MLKPKAKRAENLYLYPDLIRSGEIMDFFFFFLLWWMNIDLKKVRSNANHFAYFNCWEF